MSEENALTFVTTDEIIEELSRRTDYLVASYQLKGDPDEMMKTYHDGHKVACLGAARVLYRVVDGLFMTDSYIEIEDMDDGEDENC